MLTPDQITALQTLQSVGDEAAAAADEFTKLINLRRALGATDVTLTLEQLDVLVIGAMAQAVQLLQAAVQDRQQRQARKKRKR